MYSLRLNDANTFCSEIENKINECISSDDKKSIMYAVMTETNKLFVKDDSTNIETTCRFSYPFHNHNNSGQLDFSIEYKKESQKQSNLEIIIGIYKPSGGDIDTDYQEDTLSKLEKKLVKNFPENEKNIRSVKNIYNNKPKYYKEFNSQYWVSAVKYTIPEKKGYKDYKTEIQPLINRFIEMIRDN